MKLYRCILITVAFALSLSSCSYRGKTNDSLQLIFQGEGEHWSATYTQKSSASSDRNYMNKMNDILELKYKGTDIQNIDIVNFEFDGIVLKYEGSSRLNQNGLILIGGEGKSVWIADKNTIFTIIVSWNDEVESFSLSFTD